MSAPQGLCKGSPTADGLQEKSTAVLGSEARRQDAEQQTKSDKTASTRTPAKDDRRAEQIKSKLRSLGIASRVTIVLNNGNDRYGSIERLDEDSFQIAEVDMKQVFTVAYSDVKKVREGYGNPNQFTGKRWNPIWAKISLAAVVVMFVVVIPIAVANDR
jgi:hypothetical protein